MIPIIRTLAAALLLLLVFPLPAAAQSDTVRLRFGWTPGMRAEVQFEEVSTGYVDEVYDSMRVASTFRLETEAHPEGLLVRFTDMRWTELPEMEGAVGPLLQALVRTPSGGNPPYLVSAAGEFLRVDGAEELEAEMLAVAQPYIDAAEGEELEVLRELMRSSFSPEEMTTTLSTEWGDLVGFWVDGDLTMSGAYEADDTFEWPALAPGTTIPGVLQFDLSRIAPCTDEEVEERCVELQTASLPDHAAIHEAIAEHSRENGIPIEEVMGRLDALAVETYTTLLTEPGTLRPHFLRTIRVVFGEDPEEPLQVEMQEWRFRWLP